MTTHTRRHGGYATQAKRRGETFLGCTECQQHSHRPSYAEPEPESLGDFLRAFGTFALLMVALYVLVLAGAAWMAYR